MFAQAARAAAAVGTPAELVRRSWATQRVATPDRTLVAGGDDLVPIPTKAEPVEPREEWKEPNAARLRKFNAAKVARENPGPGKRICSRCQELKPVKAFAVRDKRTGTLRSMCKDCFRKYQ